ncbi:MAG: 6-bladed beta-propeller [Tannerellaceae bacterium]|nr:6-bladed beta-propeller [Tannerellaceae bacterium]
MTSNAELELSEYFENFRLIKLPSDTVIGEIKRIRYGNGRIYISDGNALFVFSDAGELLTCFNKTGKGPGEYTNISDFTVNGETITVLCRSLRKLIDYNHSGECVSSRDIAYWARAVSPTVEQSYFLYCGNEYGENERHKVRRIKNGHEDATYLPIDRNQAKYLHISSEHNFYRHKECIYFFEAFNDTVYKSVDGSGIKPSFYVDYKGYNVPKSFYEEEYTDVMNFFQEFHKTSYAYGVLNFAANDRFFMFNSFYQKNIKLTVADQKGQATNTYASVKDNVYFNGLTIPTAEFPFHADKHIFVPLEAYAVVEWRNTHIPAEQFKEKINATKEEDNPLLLVFDFKQ